MAYDPELAIEARGLRKHFGIALASFSLGQPSLDEVFLALTGHPAEPEPTASQSEGEPA